MLKMSYTNKSNNSPRLNQNPKPNKPILANIPILVTFSSCWYIVKSKFPVTTYLEWINNLFSIINNFNLVIYTDINGLNSLKPMLITENYIKNQDKIKIIIKPMTEFYGYRYKNEWIKNHNTSELLLHKKIDWQLNMLWCEKIHFVNETTRNRYFDTRYYGWCDIGYFRNLDYKKLDTLKMWPSPLSLLYNFPNKIHYGCVQKDQIKYKILQNDIITHYSYNNYHITKKTSPCNSKNIEEICFAGGFFVLTQALAEIYGKLFDAKLQYYFKNEYVIKDDQQIIMDCIFTNPQLFQIHFSENWFMFQEVLL
jgi:hypothetical protein